MKRLPCWWTSPHKTLATGKGRWHGDGPPPLSPSLLATSCTGKRRLVASGLLQAVFCKRSLGSWPPCSRGRGLFLAIGQLRLNPAPPLAASCLHPQTAVRQERRLLGNAAAHTQEPFSTHDALEQPWEKCHLQRILGRKQDTGSSLQQGACLVSSGTKVTVPQPGGSSPTRRESHSGTLVRATS